MNAQKIISTINSNGGLDIEHVRKSSKLDGVSLTSSHD